MFAVKFGDVERLIVVQQLRKLADEVENRKYGVIRDRDMFMLDGKISVSNIRLKTDNGTSATLTIYQS